MAKKKPAANGNRLREWRVRQRQTQAELASKLGVDESMVSSLESGRRMPGRGLAFTIETVTNKEILAHTW